MDPLTWGFIGTLVGTVVGASASISTTIINARTISKNQNKLEIYKRQEIFREFQRDNYLKIQESTYKAHRLVTLLHVEDMQNFKDSGQWQQGILNAENSNELLYTVQDLTMYLERIQNEKVREEIRKLTGKMLKVSHSSDWKEGNQLLAEINQDISIAMKILGTELRNNYYSSDATL
ncbi:hypothetical protein [Flavobacterium sp. 2]|uniref:hypothetical protein n=1 Tax=Flavobacterium sp. 2 TaxID=308053 RepID=UPI003CF34830